MKNNRLLYLLLVVVIVWLVYLTTGFVLNKKQIEETNINEYRVSGFSTDFTNVIDKCKSSSVTIDADGTISSGFIYKHDEDKVYVVSTYHGIEKAANIIVYFDSTYKTSGNVIGYDAFADLSIIEIDMPYDVIESTLGDSLLLKNGEYVISIGTPKSINYKGSIEVGVISKNLLTIENAIVVDDTNYSYYMDVIQISSNLRQGYSGSPIINMNGETIGMCLMEAEEGVNLMLPINEIKIIANNIISKSSVNKAQIGIMGSYVVDLKNYEKSYLNLPVEVINGMYVSKVKDNSLAQLAGLKVGDVIMSINDISINNQNDYLKAVYTESNTFDFLIYRDGEQTKLTGTIND